MIVYVLYLSVSLCMRAGCLHNVATGGAYFTHEGCMDAAKGFLREPWPYAGETMAVQFPTCVKMPLEDLGDD